MTSSGTPGHRSCRRSTTGVPSPVSSSPTPAARDRPGGPGLPSGARCPRPRAAGRRPRRPRSPTRATRPPRPWMRPASSGSFRASPMRRAAPSRRASTCWRCTARTATSCTSSCRRCRTCARTSTAAPWRTGPGCCCASSMRCAPRRASRYRCSCASRPPTTPRAVSPPRRPPSSAPGPSNAAPISSTSPAAGSSRTSASRSSPATRCPSPGPCVRTAGSRSPQWDSSPTPRRRSRCWRTATPMRSSPPASGCATPLRAARRPRARGRGALAAAVRAGPLALRPHGCASPDPDDAHPVLSVRGSAWSRPAPRRRAPPGCPRGTAPR